MKKILLIEDDNLLAKNYVWRIEEQGYNIETVQEASTAIELLNTKSYDFIMVDWTLENTNPVQFLASLKQQVPDVPVVVISNVIVDHEVEKAFASGASSYWAKTTIENEGISSMVNRFFKLNEKNGSVDSVISSIKKDRDDKQFAIEKMRFERDQSALTKVCFSCQTLNPQKVSYCQFCGTQIEL